MEQCGIVARAALCEGSGQKEKERDTVWERTMGKVKMLSRGKGRGTFITHSSLGFIPEHS